MWKFVSMEAIIQSVMLAGMNMMLNLCAIKSMEVDIVGLHVVVSHAVAILYNATLIPP